MGGRRYVYIYYSTISTLYQGLLCIYIGVGFRICLPYAGSFDVSPSHALPCPALPSPAQARYVALIRHYVCTYRIYI